MEGWGLGHPGPGTGGGANAGGGTWERAGDLHRMDGAPLGVVNAGGVARGKGPGMPKGRSAGWETRNACQSRRQDIPPKRKKLDSHVIPHHGINWEALQLTPQIEQHIMHSESHAHG